MQEQTEGNEKSVYDLIVIGGGPAGMMAAGRAAERGKTVLLLEKNESLGKKLLISAQGRCNVTNSAPMHVFLEAYGKAGNFLRTALTAFDNESLRRFLADRGVATVEERKGRVFPESQRADTILNALISYMNEHGVTINSGVNAVRLKLSDREIAGVETNPPIPPLTKGGKGDLYCRNCLIATGGLSYPSTGSTGDGYRMASEMGHTITPTYPSIVAFETAERWVTSLQGFPLKNVKIKAFQKSVCIAEQFGEALFTHYGISGPTILDMSKKIVESLPSGPVTLRIDLKPYSTQEELDNTILYHLKKHGGKQIKNALDGFLSPRLAPTLLKICEIDEFEKASQVGKSERKKLAKLLKDLRLILIRHRPIEEAMVTAGGVNLDEIDPKTMQSKIFKGLYFAGEILDVDGPTGGFNLQAAFSTGYLVGESIC
ncbi:MAG TPA: NAD(P)/FAD-dependent oxidoreductase [Candidatus Brocadiia bacterium]|nr:NAD(P)/FAD-dependent oxidoreductase [Planctomycetota bacterium]MDO8092563.1 NAD(P)/FAD-dependent oxidoreductase [Candidatus Brocadiales bacterium]